MRASPARPRIKVGVSATLAVYSAMAPTTTPLLLFCLVMGVCSQPAPSITFMGRFYPTYSCIDLSLVGEGENDGIQCHTDLTTCCTDLQGQARGDWYPPGSSSSLPFYSEAAYIYQERGDRRVDLYRRDLDSAGDAGEGVYKCAIETSTTFGHATIFVELKNGGCGITVDPTITLSEDYDFSDSSPRFQLICISYGSPTATWARDSSYLSTGSTTTISTSGPTIAFIHTLTVTEKLGGVYTCTAAGGSPPTNSASFYIQVASAPTNLKAVQVGLSAIRLTWTPPSPLGDTKRYIITYTSHNTQSSSVTVSETVDLTNNTLLQLQTGENYTIELAGGSDHFSSKPVTTYIYVAPVGIPESFKVTADQRDVQFSWSPPKVSAPISNYSLFCYPTLDSFPLSFSSHGSYIVTGFSPATEYRCSLEANYNSSVSGVSTNVYFTTLSDHQFVKVDLAGYIDCFEWLVLPQLQQTSPNDDKLQDIREDIVKAIADSCECVFTSSNIDRESLNCSSGSSNGLSYTARLTSTFAETDSTQLAEFVSQWVSSEPTITVEGVLFRVVEDQCIGFVATVNSDICPNHRDSIDEESVKTGLVTGVPIAGAVFFIGVLAIAVCVIIFRYRRAQRTGGADLPQQQQPLHQRQPQVPQVISNPRRQEPLLPLREEED